MALPIELVCCKCGSLRLHRYQAGRWFSLCCDAVVPISGTWKPVAVSNSASRSRGGKHARWHARPLRAV